MPKILNHLFRIFWTEIGGGIFSLCFLWLGIKVKQSLKVEPSIST